MLKIDNDRTREKIVTIQEELEALHLGRDMHDVIEGILLAMLSSGHVLIYGPPGSNKSNVIEDGISRVTGANVFLSYGSKYASLEDIVGAIRMSGLDEDKYERVIEGRLPWAHFALMDEVLECQPALVRVMHPIMNEGVFVNGTNVLQVPLKSMFGATNETIEDAVDNMPAFIDRWHLRYKVGYPEDPELLKQIRSISREHRKKGRTGTTITLAELEAAQREVLDVAITDEVDTTVGKIYKHCLGRGIIVSPRRFAQLDPVVQAKAWLRGRETADPSDLQIYRHCLWTEERHVEPLGKILNTEAKSQVNQAREMLDDIKKMHKQWKGLKHNDANRSKLAQTVKEKTQKLTKLSEEYKSQGKDPKSIDKAFEEASDIHYNMVRGNRTNG